MWIKISKIWHAYDVWVVNDSLYYVFGWREYGPDSDGHAGRIEYWRHSGKPENHNDHRATKYAAPWLTLEEKARVKMDPTILIVEDLLCG